jgi:hypothetical protein
MMTPAAMAGTKTNANSGRASMHAGADAAVADTGPGANRTDMRAGIHAMPADTCAGANDIADMTARIGAVAADTGARANRAHMSACSDAIAADMRAYAHAQDFNPRAHGIGRGRTQQGKGEQRHHEGFHRVNLWRATVERRAAR